MGSYAQQMEEGFNKAIEDCYIDPHNYHVYADWLEENNESEVSILHRKVGMAIEKGFATNKQPIYNILDRVGIFDPSVYYFTSSGEIRSEKSLPAIAIKIACTNSRFDFFSSSKYTLLARKAARNALTKHKEALRAGPSYRADLINAAITELEIASKWHMTAADQFERNPIISKSAITYLERLQSSYYYIMMDEHVYTDAITLCKQAILSRSKRSYLETIEALVAAKDDAVRREVKTIAYWHDVVRQVFQEAVDRLAVNHRLAGVGHLIAAKVCKDAMAAEGASALV